MEKCFNHNEINSENSCTQCGKNYCSDCLLLIGYRKVVVCKECYSIIMNQNNKANKRRYLVIGLGSILLILSLRNIIELITEDIGDNFFVLYLILSGAMIYAISKSIIKIYQTRTLKIVDKYKKEEKTIS